MRSSIKLIIFLAVSFLFPDKMFPQTFGFGCLGFFSGYGGFSYQQFDAYGLNNYIAGFNQSKSSSLQSPLDEFTSASGYRVGINIFRANFPAGFFVTAKGYYQSIGKKNLASETSTSGTTNYEFDLELKNWALGFDVGLNLIDRISWKMIDGALHFNNVKFTTIENSPGATSLIKYESDAGVLGYSIGTGIIIYVIKDYISVEGLAGYTFLQIEDMKTEDGEIFPVVYPDPDPMPTVVQSTNFIDGGGFNAVIQLNFGIPL
jgi:hypothetical protein